MAISQRCAAQVRRLLNPKALLAVAITSLVVASASVGTLTWIAVDPQFWFPEAFAERGDQGPRGPRGPVGPRGPAGPVGPDAEDAISSVAFDVDDLRASVDDVLSTLDPLESDSFDHASRLDDLESQLQDLESWLQEICDQFYYYTGAFEEIYLAAC